MDVELLKQGQAMGAPTVSGSMATAVLAYSGIAVKMLVDQRLDAQLHTMFMVDYQPGACANPHDHPFEESYYILEGEVDVVADGDRYTLRPGDVFWTGTGCVHAFYETQGKPVLWLETSAPGPPPRHSYRHQRDWDYLVRAARIRRRSRRGVSHVSDEPATGVLDDLELYTRIYRQMLLIRGFEDLVQSLFLAGEVYGTTHLYSGTGGRRDGLRKRPRGPRPHSRDLPWARPRARHRRRPAGAARRDARARVGRQRRPRRLDERELAGEPDDRLVRDRRRQHRRGDRCGARAEEDDGRSRRRVLRGRRR